MRWFGGVDMARFDQKRAQAFGEYSITAMLRDAEEAGNIFVRISRSDFANALDTKRLYDYHIEAVRGYAASSGVGMANLGHEFVFFTAGGNESTLTLNAKTVKDVTDFFNKLLGSEAADDAWADRSYQAKAEAKPLRTKRGDERKSSTKSIRLRG